LLLLLRWYYPSSQRRNHAETFLLPLWGEHPISPGSFEAAGARYLLRPRPHRPRKNHKARLILLRRALLLLLGWFYPSLQRRDYVETFVPPLWGEHPIFPGSFSGRGARYVLN
jgi:hypothetical protein